MATNQYFVSFGREQGGLLALLGLPPDTSIAEVGRKKRDYQKSLDGDLRKRRSELKAEREAGRITPEIFEAEAEKEGTEKTARLTKLNALSEAWEKGRSQRRALFQSAETSSGSIWREMSHRLSAEDVWNSLSRPFPVPQVDAARLQQALERWLGSQNVAPGRQFPLLASNRYVPAGPVDVHTAVQLATERNLVHLMAADLLWLSLSHTNRNFWNAQLRRWVHEMDTLGPRFVLEGVRGQKHVSGALYPSLCRPRTEMIEHLEAGKAAEFSRPAASTPDRIAELLGRLDQRRTSGGTADDPASGNRLSAEELFRLLMEDLDKLRGK